MRNLTQGITRFFIRLSAFIRKELVELLRQTRLVLTLVVGPFLILLLFGIGYRDEPRSLRTLFVVPEGSPMADSVQEFAQSLGPNIEFAGITSSADEADRQLRQELVDLVVVVPQDPMTNLLNNQQATFVLYHYEIDPFEVTYVNVVGNVYVTEVNRRVLQTVADEGKVEAASLQEDVRTAQEHAVALRQALESGDAAAAQLNQQTLGEDIDLLTIAVGSSLALYSGLQENLGIETADEAESLAESLASIKSTLDTLSDINTTQQDFTAEAQTAADVEERLSTLDTLLGEFQAIDSFVLVSPFANETRSITNVALQPTHFYAPGVIALLLQHIAVTIAALSLIRERLAGTMELFRISPVSAFEMLLGKNLSYLLLTGGLAAVLTVLVVYVLGVPMLGNWSSYIAAIIMLLLASMAIGFVISLIARTDSQAVQYAMIVLLSSVFFTGFFLPLYRLWAPVRLVSWFIPTSYGINLLQGIMLRGQTADLAQLFFLFVLSLILFLFAWWRLRRLMVYES